MVSNEPGSSRMLLLHASEFRVHRRASSDDLSKLLVHFGYGFFRLVRLNRGVREVGALAPGAIEHRSRAVGPVLIFAQIHIRAVR